MAHHFESALQIAEKIQAGKITSEEITTEMLHRIGQLDPYLKSFVTIMAEDALQAAKQADVEITRGKKRSALHGGPIAIKDLFDLKGVQTTYGMKIYAGHLPTRGRKIISVSHTGDSSHWHSRRMG